MARDKGQVQAQDSEEKVSSSEIDDLRAQAARDLAEASAKAETKTEVTKASAPAKGFTMPVNPNSIRQTIRRMLGEGKSTKDIAAVLTEKFPGSAAAAKSTKHIAYYRSQLRKEAKAQAKS